MRPCHKVCYVASITPSTYRKFTAFALGSLALIIVTGATVRLTGSGLGCSDWPTCEENQLYADFEFHPMVEFINRLVTGVVSIAAIGAVLGSMRRSPRRSDLTRWSWGLVVGVLAQIVLGAIVVNLELDPRTVLLHFLVSMVLIWNAVVLHHRAGLPDRVAEPIPIAELVWPKRLLSGIAALVLVIGTLVTGSGPHTGERRADGVPVERLPFSIREITRIHSVTVLLLLAGVLATFWLCRKHGIFDDVRQELGWLLVAIVVQGTIGYVQYFTGVPAWLVGLHIVGAIMVWVAVVRFHLGATRATNHDMNSPTT